MTAKRKLLEALLSPKTSALLKLCIAVVGVLSALNEIRSISKNEDGFRFDGDDV